VRTKEEPRYFSVSNATPYPPSDTFFCHLRSGAPWTLVLANHPVAALDLHSRRSARRRHLVIL
jgi:hypothetical protein